MIRVSHRQLDALHAERRNAFHDRLRADILAFMGRAAPDTRPEEVTARIAAALGQADGHGMVTEQQITRYAYILAAFPLDHRRREEFAWLGEVLDGPSPADLRLDQVTAALTRTAPETGR
ncbi:hypothetical protein [Azospirillum doebereinerae]|uniref:Uncharacterized protein n=1 Tax=Azospirillum doebereinerae TaxID=92933 RepID=A0A433JDZ2_9PROT|nr:hypothetical protein [Azospirillum doebereinerae]MCG5239246.1 hypothetical protein [Azospirillum doebereinerae]RUQ75120.1 hypothetical protein EJ913_04515 [Azospirillum doebereinerae]